MLKVCARIRGEITLIRFNLINIYQQYAYEKL